MKIIIDTDGAHSRLTVTELVRNPRRTYAIGELESLDLAMVSSALENNLKEINRRFDEIRNDTTK